MPNEVTITGLVTKTQAELVAENTAALQAIYGTDINLEPSTPDGQEMMIRIQAVLDLLDLVRQVYNGFDPDNAIGATLDQRVALNGIQRKGGTFSLTDITIVTTASCILYGLNDASTQPVYTIADNEGNRWQLLTTVELTIPGTYVEQFRAVVPGAQLTTINTINVPVTVVLGVQSVNNPTPISANDVGITEESDAALRVRRQKSVALGSQGYYAGLLAALNNIEGVDSAFIIENDTDATVDTVPSHSIWVIIDSTDTDPTSTEGDEIAQAIYTKRNAGCGMKGDAINIITQVDGSLFVVRWDYVVSEDLYIKFTVSSLNGTNAPDIVSIRAGLVADFVPGVNAQVNINDLATVVQSIDPNTLVTSSGFSLTSGGSFTPTLSPSAQNKQFHVTSPDIIIIPMQMSSPNSRVSVAVGVVVVTLTIGSGGQHETFTGLGGFGTLTYTVVSGAGAINSSTGVYTSAGTGTDVVRVTDGQSNTADATITVI